MVKSWQLSHAGGGRSADLSQRSTLEVNSYVIRFGDFSLSVLNPENLQTFVSEMMKKYKAKTVLVYIRYIKKVVEYLLHRYQITNNR